jgi:hypothetical protein
MEPLFLPVILGTPRQERWSQPVAEFVTAQLALWPGVETMLVDVRDLPLPVTGAGEDIKDPAFSELCMRADGFVIVAPEYNHGYPGLLKHVLDTNLKEYIHKPVGLCGVSAEASGDARHREPSAGDARARPRHDLLGRELLQRPEAFRPGRPAARPRVRQAHPQIR